MLVISPSWPPSPAGCAPARCADPALPSLVAYDYAKCKNSQPLPLLFQRTAGKGISKAPPGRAPRALVHRVLGLGSTTGGAVPRRPLSYRS
jgi:hypothetical protein